jgi:type I restriction enzyme R subunit
MSEYQFVEKPLLNQLASMGWLVIDQGEGVPKNPATSLRSTFREVILKETFIQSVKAINSWVTDKQLEQLYQDVTDLGTHKLLEANQEFLSRLYKWQLDENTVTGEQTPVVKLIDFENSAANHFVAINQFRIDTPGQTKDHIRPDIVLFVNGIPLVVIECKDVNAYTSEPLHEAVEQLRRYADLREDTIAAGLREGEPRLFFSNQLMIATHGDDCRVGSITSTEEFYYQWRSIYPDEQPYIDPVIGVHRLQEQLVQGMLKPATLLDISRSFLLFMDAGKQRVKVICRYQQYRAADRIVQRLRTGTTSRDRSGVVWHTQGSGKSLTMVFLVRKLRRCEDLKDYKVLMVNDRKDLEVQLSETAVLTGEKVTVINSSESVKDKLKTDASNLNMVMVHKFREADDSNVPLYVKSAINADAANDANMDARSAAEPKQFEVFGVVNNSDRILMLIDEAHRTQRSGSAQASLSDNLFDAFPNAARIAFTGTPLIADHHKEPTYQRFGDAIDKYKLQDAVDDGVTLQILYEGKTADTAIHGKHEFDKKFEDLFKDRSEEELQAIRKKYGATGDILEAEKRIEETAEDMLRHYVAKILPGGFKAQVVCSSKQAAVYYKTYLDKAIAKLLAELEAENPRDEELIHQLQFIKTVVVISADGTNEKAVFTEVRKQAKELDAVENFKKKFEYDKPETGIAFLIVCDMLLTGFDAPVEQVMYIDKKLREHNLLQTIARVNRTAKGKTRGYIVDYVGLANHLKEALSLYAGEEQEALLASLQSVESEMPVLESRYRRLVQLFTDAGVAEIEPLVQQQMHDLPTRYRVMEAAVRVLEDIKQRDSFNVYLKKFMQSMDIVLPNSLAQPYKIPMYQFAHIQAKAKERYKDDSMNLAGAGEKVRKLINEHLIGLGINPKIPPVELFSTAFIQQVQKEGDSRAQASEMEHAIRKHCKVNGEDDPVFFKTMSEKLESIIKKLGENWEQMVLALGELRTEVLKGRGDDADGKGPFHDLSVVIAFGASAACPTQYEKALAAALDEVMDALADTIGVLDFWERPALVSELDGKLKRIFILADVPELNTHNAQLATELIALARRREKDILDRAAGGKQP